MMYYHIYLLHGNKYTYHCVITQTIQNGQTLQQFFELLYRFLRVWIIAYLHSHQHFLPHAYCSSCKDQSKEQYHRFYRCVCSAMDKKINTHQKILYGLSVPL